MATRAKALVAARELSPVDPVPPTLKDALAIQALARHEADAEQQKIALDWILRKACALGQWAYREATRETDVMLGRQFVGQQIMGMINVNISSLRRNDDAIV